MFIAADRTVPVSTAKAQERLSALMGAAGGLSGACQAAHAMGAQCLTRAGLPPLGRLEQVRLTAVSCRDAAQAVALRWETAAAGSDLFPLLDADIRLDASGPGTRIGLTGCYRLPPGMPDAGPDCAPLRAAATTTAACLLAELAALLATQPGRQARPTARQIPGTATARAA